MSPNRAVAVLTPLVFAPLAGAVAAWLAEHAPGVNIAAADLQEIFIAGALIAFAKSAQWLRGWQQFEQREATAADDADRQDAELLAGAAIGAGAVGSAPAFEEDPAIEDVEGAVTIAQFDGAEMLSAFDDDDLLLDEDPLLSGVPGTPS